jgi:HAD superfamily hydrolase (TIGR01509 family)
MSEPKVRAIIFDLDGTLADTFPLIVRAWNAAITPHTGKSYSDAEVIARFGIPDSQMIRRELAGAAGEQAVEVYHAAYENEHGIVKPFAGINEMLSELKRRTTPMGLMTGKDRRSALITLKALGWDRMFAAVITGDDVTRQKPQPDGPLEVARQLKIDPNHCAFVGDSPADIGGGKAAGMITVAAGWHPVYLEKIRAMRPDVWAELPGDVVKLVAAGTLPPHGSRDRD